MKVTIGVLLFVILNIIVIPMATVFQDSVLFYIGGILTFIQIVVGFSTIYGIIVSKLTKKETNRG